MEFEQIIKRLDWLDAEQRKTKSSIATTTEQLAAVETSLSAIVKQMKSLEKSIAEVTSSAARLNQFNEMIARQRDDFNKALDTTEKKYLKQARETAKRHLDELEPVQAGLEKLRMAITPDIAALKSEIKVRAGEYLRLNDAVALIQPQIDDVLRAHDEVKIAQKILDENRRQDIKRVADVQGELAALRKRIDEARAKSDITADSLRNVENRTNELLLSESERKTAQAAFIEQQMLTHIDRERTVKEWQSKFEEFKAQGRALDTQIATLDEALRAAKKSQEVSNDLNTKLERRINEISEMQRLAEDRLRQEWITFKADDQKRWTGASLSQEEAMRDLRKDMNRFEERVAALDDLAQIIQDQMHQTADVTEQQLQELMNVAHQWMTSYERIMGHGKKTRKTTK